MPADQCCDLADGFVVEFQTAQNRFRHFLPRRCVAFKMIDAGLIRCAARRFCNVVEQHRPAQNRICRNVLQSGNRVLTDIIAVVRIVLRRFHQFIKLRQHNLCNTRLIDGLHILRPLRYQQFIQFHTDPLGADFFKRRRECYDGIQCCRIEFEAELCGKAEGTQDPQCILTEPLGRISDTADDFAL